MISADRLIVDTDTALQTVSVSLRPDWRGMNNHSLGVWRLPLDETAAARLAGLGVNLDDVLERLSQTG